MKLEMGMPAPAGNGGEAQLFSSKAGILVKKLIDRLAKDNIDTSTLTDASARELLSGMRMLPGVTVDEVVAEMKKTGIIKPPAPVKKAAVPPLPPVHIETKKVELAGTTLVEDQDILQRFEENKKFNDHLAGEVFIDEKDLDAVLARSLTLGKENSVESPEYYYAFADAGLIKGGRKEVEKDMAHLAESQKLFSDRTAGRETKGKKIATVVERAIAYSVSDLGWYGDKVSIEPASQFDDIYRGIDDVLEIKRDDDSSKFLALGIDVTYQGIFSEKYKEKVFKLLHSVEEGRQKKLKYFKNHKGEMMPEFAVPKTILSFDLEAVKDLVGFIKNVDSEEARENFKNHPMKLNVLNQMMIQCELLLKFAEECGNDISVQYNEIVTSIELLSRKSPEIRQALSARKNDEIAKRFGALIREYTEASSGHSYNQAA